MPSEIVRANLCYLLSRAYSDPAAADDSLPQRLRELSAQLPAESQEEAVELADTWEDALADRQTVSRAYAMLFIGPFEILASPYASFYLEAEQRIMGAVSNHVAQKYAEAGLVPGEGPREVPDHVALEWEFLHYLTHQYVVTGEAHWLERRDAFFSEHVAAWMPALAMAITQADAHPFYNALAKFQTTLLPMLAGR